MPYFCVSWHGIRAVFHMFKSRVLALFRRGFLKIFKENPVLLSVILYFTVRFSLDKLNSVQIDSIASLALIFI